MIILLYEIQIKIQNKHSSYQIQSYIQSYSIHNLNRRKENVKLKDFLSCKICFESYNSVDRKPLQLPCFHTACRRCLVHLEGGNGSITCFKCRVEQQGNVDALKPNQALLEAVEEMPIGMEDFIRQSEAPSKQILMCANHSSKEATFHCDKENVQICGDCVAGHLNHSDSLKGYDHSEFIKKTKSNMDLLQKEIETLNKKMSSLKELTEIKKLSSDKNINLRRISIKYVWTIH